MSETPKGQEDIVKRFVDQVARHADDLRFVPGVQEAEDMNAGYQVFLKFLEGLPHVAPNGIETMRLTPP
jgi:hypothetical protein